jgi:hypothetical protein
VPLYEGKTFDMYDHRRASIVLSEQALFRPRQPRETTLAEHQSPSYVAIPYYWVKSEVAWSKFPWDWFIGFKKVTSVTNERTMIAAILPKCAVNDTVHILRPCQSTPVHLLPLLLANLCSLALDYLGRQKVGGNAYSMFIAKQLPIIPPDWYVPDHFDFIIPRVVELTYTAWDLQPYAQDVLDEVGPETWAQWFKDAPVHTSPPPAWAEGDTPTPFVWDEARRARLRAELDALYAHLYGLTHDELAYILDTFPIVWRKDEEKYGEYRTKRMILENYDVLDSRMR